MTGSIYGSQNAHPENWRNESFESQTNGPPGWTVQTLRGSEWSIGPTSNSSNWGPGYWPSGNNGAGIVLNGKYAANSWTHLISPTYVNSRKFNSKSILQIMGLY